jgi:hypothetical protein
MSERLPAPFVAGLWLLGSLVTLWMVWQGWGQNQLSTDKDYANLWVAGRLAIEGNVAAVFDVEAFRQASVPLLGERIPGNYSYPPHALFLAIPFAALPYEWSLVAWTLVGMAFFMWAAREHCRKIMPLFLVVLTPAALDNIRFGHYGFFAGGLFLLAFSNRDRIAGIAAAALTIKPHLGLMVAVQMLRNRKALVVAILATVALVAASLIVFGPAAWRAFLTETFSYQSGLIAPGSRGKLLHMMPTPLVGYGLIGHLIFAAAAVVLLTRNFNVFTAATATFLILPYAFHYDMTVANLGFAVLIFTRWDEMGLIEKLVACLGFLVPEFTTFGSWFAPPILLAGLYVQTRRLEGEPLLSWPGRASAGSR